MSQCEAIYARQSIEKKDSISVDNQIELCKRELAGNTYRIYTDRGFSGKDTERPAFQRMMRDVENGKIQRVIVYKLDRISRSVLDFSSMIVVFQQHNVDFVSTVEKFDTTTAIGKAMLMIIMVFAQLERETIQQRVTDSYKARCSRGLYMGGRLPFGFALEDTVIDGVRTKMYIPIESDEEIIRMIFDMYARPRTSLADVAGVLNEHFNNRNFTRTFVRSIVINPIYAKADRALYAFFQKHGTQIRNTIEQFSGDTSAYLYSKHKGSKRNCALEEQTLVLAPHRGIVSGSIWASCREKIINHTSGEITFKNSKYWLAGKIKCRFCGYAMLLKVSRCKTKADNRYYICSRQCRADGGKMTSLNADVVDEIVVSEIIHRINSMGLPVVNKENQDNTAITQLRSNISELDRELSLLLDRVASADEISMRYINNRIRQIDCKKAKFKHKLEQIKSINKETLFLSAEDVNKLDILDKHVIVESLIESIELSRNSIQIYWLI